MKKLLAVLRNALAVCGMVLLAVQIAFWLDTSGDTKNEYKITGKVKQLYTAGWNGCEQRYALVETEDGKGEVIVTIFRSYSGLNEGDEVSLIITHSGSSGSKRVFAWIDRKEPRRIKSLRKNHE